MDANKNKRKKRHPVTCADWSRLFKKASRHQGIEGKAEEEEKTSADYADSADFLRGKAKI